jgi:PAS domain S-box-containing protein
MPTLRILIVNDPTGQTGALEARLVALGYEVAGVASSYEEIAIGASAVDMVLTGTRLADGIDGTMEAIRGSGPMPVVFVGAAADEENVRRLEPSLPHAFLAIPCSDRELRSTVELARSRQETARAAHDLESYFDVSLDLLCVLGGDGYFKRLNPAWEETLGFTREELRSRPFTDFVHPDDRRRTLEQNARVRAGEKAREFENRYLCKDGSHRWLHWNAALHSARGLIYSAARDVTARKRIEAEREELIAELEASLAEVKSLRDILPICMYCKKIRDDEDYWQTVESYISRHTSTQFSHGICPDCMATEIGPELL